MALGARLRAYKFDRYKTKKKDADKDETAIRIAFAVADPAAAKKAAKISDALAAGIVVARDLVNEPPNVLGPEEFATRAEELRKLGVEVEVLDEKAMRKLGMRALLGVGQGSRRGEPGRDHALERRQGRRQPVAFVGKGVVFDSGGIRSSPARHGGHEGRHGGRGCVVGLMHALAPARPR
jgi:leucyl aminopeptidase